MEANKKINELISKVEDIFVQLKELRDTPPEDIVSFHDILVPPTPPISLIASSLSYRTNRPLPSVSDVPPRFYRAVDGSWKVLESDSLFFTAQAMIKTKSL